MVFASPSELLDWLARFQFLKPAQTDEIRSRLATLTDCHALAKDLIARDWLTPYQVNQILTGKADQLILGDYRLRERLGEGAMGQVFKAWSLRLERIVAVKTIHKEFVNAKAMGRFRREMETASRLDHPNIALVRDADEVGGRPYLVLDFVEGFNLSARVKQQGPLPIAVAVEYARQTALGLQHAYERGVVHRDIKPANLLVSTANANGETQPLVKILDFGLARYESENENSTRLTAVGSMLGTIDYVSPEQAQNSRAADIRADIYSLGCTLFYLLTAKPPFPGTSVVEKLGPRVTGDPPRVRDHRPEIDLSLEEVILKMMARLPEDRYQTPIEAATALQPFTGVPAVPMAMPVTSDVPLAQPMLAEPVSASGDGPVFLGMSATGRDPATGAAPPAKPRRLNPAVLIGAGAFVVFTGLCLGACLLGYHFFSGPPKNQGEIRITEAKYSMADKKAIPGKTHRLLVTIERVKFSGPVELSLKDLPAGVTGKTWEIAPTADRGEVAFTVSFGMDPLKTNITLRAENKTQNIVQEMSLPFEVADVRVKGKK